ncbi:hypothetical protein F5J12DRAFT_895137 [Pisolithus orientalis]|uniref:uncharacterized protein n=1 Tax=Pisolithus orientalis TaxID=936130 RepID=UPI002224F2DD|nr:uncharacterized protein F5J12DRAFT_895137 [Pisolithus orientalis]KAI5999301.1 hypothetical protein F5J12DRAFT_895137 [Pisolithus orientalis]
MSLFTLSTELLLLILDELDPVSLFRFCKASQTILTLVGGTTSLRYRYELALCGLREGLLNQCSPKDQLATLLSYKRAWSTFTWSAEDRLTFPPPTIMGVSGNYLYQAVQFSEPNGFVWALRIYELRCFRRTPQRGLYFKQYLLTFDVRKVVIDPSQSLMIWAQIYFPPQQNSPVLGVLHFRDTRGDYDHREAAQPRLQYRTEWWGITPPGERVSIQQVQVCGSLVALSIRLELEDGEGITELALLNWRTGAALRTFTGDKLTFDLVSDTRVIVVCQPDDDEERSSGSSSGSYERRPDGLYAYDKGTRSPQIGVYEICHEPGQGPLPRARSYEFPESWNTVSFVQQCPNSSAKMITPPAPGILFDHDPRLRLIAVTFDFPYNAKPRGLSRKVVVVIDESKLMPADDGDEVVRWADWQEHCMILNLPNQADGVQLCGRRLIFFENVQNSAGSPQDPSSRVHSLDLNPSAAPYLWSLARQSPPWRWQASVSTVFDHRGSKYVRTSTSNTHDLTWMDVTEDSLILYHEREGRTGVRILTFGQELRTEP